MSISDLLYLIPIMLVAGTSVVVMLVTAFFPYHALVNRLTLLGLVLAMASLGRIDVTEAVQITPLIIIDSFAYFFTGLLLAAGIVITLLSEGYFRQNRDEPFLAGEYYILLTVAILGGLVLVSSNHFASFFIGLELLGVSLYVLVAYLGHAHSGRQNSLEAGIKYLILSGVASALLLFGIALIYAQFGTLEFTELGVAWSRVEVLNDPFVAIGLALILAGISFKLSLVPFHMWTPDVYEGSPAPSTAFVATVSKGAIFALLLRFFVTTGVFEHAVVFYALSGVAILSMLGGNLLALLQSNIKRVLAYSSIAHIGYLMVAFLAGHSNGVSSAEVAESVSFYLVAYFISTLGALGVVIVRSQMQAERDLDQVEDYRGLFWTNPLLATVMTAMLLSLAGIPLTVGFVGKFYVFMVGVQGFQWLLLAALMLGSAIGLYYYLRIIVVIFARPDGPPLAGEEVTIEVSLRDSLVLAGLGIMLLWLGVFPQSLIEIIRSAGLG